MAPKKPKKPEPTVALYHGTTVDRAKSIVAQGQFNPGWPTFKEEGGYTYFTTDPNEAKKYGSSVVRVDVPESVYNQAETHSFFGQDGTTAVFSPRYLDALDIRPKLEVEYLTLYHGTTSDKLNAIRQTGLQSPKSVASAGWPMLTESYDQAAGYINGKPGGIVLEYKVPVDKVYQRGRKDAVLWKPTESSTYGVTATEYALRQPVPITMLAGVHKAVEQPKKPITDDELLDLIGGNKFIDPKPVAPQEKRPTYREHLLQTEDSTGNAHVIMPTELVDRYREYQREPGGKDYRSEYEDVRAVIEEQGIRQPLWISTDGKTAMLVEGNNRVAAAKELGIEELPVRLTYDKETRRSDVDLGAKPAPLDPDLKEWVRENRIREDYRGKTLYGSDAFPDRRIGGTGTPDRIGFAKPERIIPGLDAGPPEPQQKSRTSRSYANPVNRENIKAQGGAIDPAYRAAVQDINHKVTEYVRAAYRSDPGFLTNHMEIDRLTALMAPAVAAGQMQIAQLTNAHLATLFGLEDIPPVDLSKLGRNGVNLNDELARPFWTAIKAAREGKDITDALAAGERRMEKMLDTDFQMAKVRQSREVLKASGVRTYQRVAGPNACWLCAIAATQVYYTEDLLPIHPRCHCDVAPIPPGGQDSLDRKLEPDHILSEDASQVKLMAPMVENDASPAEYRDLIAVREHGETGPTLTWAHQKFTGPQDLPTPPSKEVLAQQAYDIVRANGGITIDLAGHQPTEGFAYAPYKTTEFKVPESEFTPKHIDDYIDSHAKQLGRKGNHLGMWVQDGNVYLDVSKVGPPDEAILAKAQAGHQLAVFDLSNFEEINLGTIDPETKGYKSLGPPADILDQYRRQVAGRDEGVGAGSVATLPGSDSGSRSAARELTWDGPPLADPITEDDDPYLVRSGIYDLWATEDFEEYKEDFRQGARIAQREGYSGFDPDGETGFEYGKEIVAGAAVSEPSEDVLYRGIRVKPRDMPTFKVGDTVSMPLSSFSLDATEAGDHATGENGWQSGDVPVDGKGIVFELEPGAKTYKMYMGNDERISFGQFEILGVTRYDTDGTTYVSVRQTSMIEDGVANSKPGTTALQDKSKIPEFTIVEKPMRREFGTLDPDTGKPDNRWRDYIEEVQPGPIPADYDNSHAINRQLIARHPDLKADLGSMIDPELALSTARELDDLMTKYPDAQLRSALARSPYDFKQHSTRYAQTDVFDSKVLSGTKIEFNNSNYIRKADLEKSYAETTAIPEGKRYGYHPPLGEGNDAAKAIAAHEFGHTVDASGSYRASARVKDVLRREFLRTHPYTDEQKATDRILVANAAKRGITIRQPIETRYDAWLQDSLSGYSFHGDGRLNPTEALAEAFGHAELDPGNITDAERVLHQLNVDMHTKPYKLGMKHPGWDMGVDATPTKAVAAKEKARAPRPDGVFRDKYGDKWWSLDGKTYASRIDYENALGGKAVKEREAEMTAKVGDVPLYLKGVDAQGQKEIERTVDKLTKKYPNSGLREITTPRPDESVDSRDWAWANGGGVITVNPEYFGDSKALNKEAHRLSDNRYSTYLPPGRSGVEQTIVHEFGHKLDFQGLEETRKVAGRELKKAFLQDNPKFAGMKATDPKVKNAYQKWLEDGLSGYSFEGGYRGYNARLNIREAVADAFCDVEMNGDKASRPAHVLHDLVVKNAEPEAVEAARVRQRAKREKEFRDTGMYKRSPTEIAEAKEVKRLAAQEKKEAAAAEKKAIQDEAKRVKEELKALAVADLKTPEGQIRKARIERDKQEKRIAKGDKGSLTGQEEKTRAAMDPERIKANRTALWEEVSEKVKVEGKKWYPGESELLVDILNEYGAPLANDPLRVEKVKALGSSYSPQTIWDSSKIDVRAHLESLHMSQKDRIQYIVDARGGMHITENIIRADRVIAATTLEEIDLALRGAAGAKSHYFDNSRKIRHFFPNLNGDLDLLTADVWDGRAVRLSPNERRSLVNTELLEMNSRLKTPLPVEKVKQYADGERVRKQHVVLADDLADKANAAARAAGKKEPYLPSSGDMILYGYDIIEEATKAVVPDGYHVADVQAGMWIWVRGSG